MNISSYGPWSPTCTREERGKHLRCLRAIAHLQLGANHPLVAVLRTAEIDPMAFVRAQELVEKLPALKRRHLLAAFSAISWPPCDGERDFAGSIDEAYRAVRERVAAGGPGWTPKTEGEP